VLLLEVVIEVGGWGLMASFSCCIGAERCHAGVEEFGYLEEGDGGYADDDVEEFVFLAIVIIVPNSSIFAAKL
jgi:hypothetical protein